MITRAIEKKTPGLAMDAHLGMRRRGYSACCGSKGGLVMFIRQHASEPAPHGITASQ